MDERCRVFLAVVRRHRDDIRHALDAIAKRSAERECGSRVEAPAGTLTDRQWHAVMRRLGRR
jgi:hypothetical protein